jgi:hypothetical protein
VKVVGPLRRSGAGLPDHPFAHRDDEADLFGQRNEVGRRDHPLARMIPAYQGLEAADFLARQVDDRLIVQLEFACRQRLAQILFHDAAGLHLQVHHGFEEAECAAAVALGAVEREVGVAQQFVGVRSVAGTDRNADADADHGLLTVDDVIGLTQRVDDGPAPVPWRRQGSAIVACTMTNSSPPIRAIVSASPTRERNRSATILSSLSPQGWPNVSFTALN